MSTGVVTGLGASENKSTPLTAANDFDLGAGKGIQMSYGKTQEAEQYHERQEIHKAPPSIINRYALFKYKGMPWNGNELAQEHYNLRNTSLDNLLLNPTAALLIEKFGNIGSMAMRYNWSDFLYAKYYGRIPNNYMITLRRFPYPVTDNIIDNVVTDSKTGNLISGDQPDLARAITWMSEQTGNKLSDILKFTTKLQWQEIESTIQTITSNNQGIQGSKFIGIGTTGITGAGAARSSALSSFFTLGSGQTTASARQLEANSGYDPLSNTYPNYVQGPINVIKKINIRDAGLEFDHDFELKFHYSLRSIGDVDPKMAMLDMMTNLLVLTYNTAPFFGGATRYIGNGKFGKPLGDHEKLAAGDVTGFLKSVVNDIGNAISNVFGDGKGGFNLSSVLKGIGDIAGDMLGGILSKELNTPQQAQAANAFLTGDPTGQWHLTIGNPFNPICMIGNLILKETVWEFGGALSRHDFPTELTVTIKLAPGRPRDSADIESMFNAGRGRFYYAPKGLDDVLNLEGKESIKISGYSKNPDQSGAPGDAFNQIRESNSGNNINWSHSFDKEEFIEGRIGDSSVNMNLSPNIESIDRAHLLVNNIFHVNEG